MRPVREELEERGDVESFTTRTDSLGREQPCGSSGDPEKLPVEESEAVQPVRVER